MYHLKLKASNLVDLAEAIKNIIEKDIDKWLQEKYDDGFADGKEA